VEIGEEAGREWRDAKWREAKRRDAIDEVRGGEPAKRRDASGETRGGERRRDGTRVARHDWRDAIGEV